MRLKPANLSIRRSFVQTASGNILPVYLATYRGLLLGDWVHCGGDNFFFSLPNGKILYRGVQTKSFIFRVPKSRLNRRMALVRLSDLRKATLTLLKRDLL